MRRTRLELSPPVDPASFSGFGVDVWVSGYVWVAGFRASVVGCRVRVHGIAVRLVRLGAQYEKNWVRRFQGVGFRV